MQSQYHRLLYHAVWATRMQQSLIGDTLRPELHKYLCHKVGEYGGTIMAVGGMDDHVHIVFSIPPHLALAPFIGRLKGSSSHWINHFQIPESGFSWQGGYGVLSIANDDLDRICNYVREQASHHANGTILPLYEDTIHKTDGRLKHCRYT